MPMTETRAESFCMAMNWLPTSGMMMRMAWGRMMRFMACQRVMPMAMAASHWPWPMDWMPARKISVM